MSQISAPLPPPFRPDYAPDDVGIARQFLAEAGLPPDREARIDAEARRLIGAIRGRAGGIGGIEALLREYSLTTPEGLALMVLAEGLLRVPDDATADRLIEDKLGQGGFATSGQGGAKIVDTMLVNASAWALGLSARLIGPQDTPEGILRGVVRRLGLPTVRAALRQAMRVMGRSRMRLRVPAARLGVYSGIVSICLARAPARRRMPTGIRRVTRPRSRRSAMRRATSRCRTGLASA
jgi:RHH-type proline utilization regulon transcriptional repressor/proline dehydrogenase/delta 1-pyrroline-5-carboxylate dehydrogenase